MRKTPKSRSVPKPTPVIKHRSFLPLVLVPILLLAAFARFYKLSELFHFTLDEEYWSYVPYNIATGYHIPLIGGPISGTGMYLGPLFVWLLAIPFAIFSGNPLAAAAVSAGLGICTTWLIYQVGRRLIDEDSALAAALIWASSFLMIIYDRKFWNATPIPLLTLIILLCVHEISQGRLRWAFVLAPSLALAFHAHMTSGVLLLFVVVCWIVLRLPIRRREIVLAAALFLALQLPLVAFELRHDFLNSKALSRLLAPDSESVNLGLAVGDVSRLTLSTLARAVYLPRGLDIADELTLCLAYAQKRFLPPTALAAVSLLGLIFLWRKRTKGTQLLLLIPMINVVSLVWFRLQANPGSWYGGQLNEYYLLPSFPAFILALGAVVSKLRRAFKLAWLAVIGLIFFVSFNIAALLTAQHSDGYAGKAALVKEALNANLNTPFRLSVTSTDHCRLYGYRYLFSVNQREPADSYLDGEFGWLYERRLPKAKPLKELIISSEKGKKSFEIRSLENGVESDP